MTMMAQSAQEWVAATRSADYDRFLAIQCAPRGARGALYALTAFHLELARVVATVSEPLIGHIRLAWWREALEELAASKPPRNHPLVLALAEIQHTYPAVLPYFLTMIDARSGELEPAETLTDAAWTAHMDATDGALSHAWATMLDMTIEETQARAITAHAQAFAMLAQLRAIPLHAALHLPDALLAAHGVDSPAPSPALNGLVEEVVSRASALLAGHPLAAPSKPIAALSKLTQLHIKRLRAAGHDPHRLRPAKLAAVWQMLWQ